MRCAGEDRTALYRFYDSARERLYVGISNDPWRRWREHVLTASWYPQARHWTVSWYDSEHAARQAETKAIIGEFPRFNKAGAPEPAPVRFTVRFGAIGAACVPWAMLPPFLAIAAVLTHWYWLVPVTVVASLSVPVPLAVLFLASFGPEIRRFGSWLDRHVINEQLDV
jgi:hypothetical protein